MDVNIVVIPAPIAIRMYIPVRMEELDHVHVPLLAGIILGLYLNVNLVYHHVQNVQVQELIALNVYLRLIEDLSQIVLVIPDFMIMVPPV